MKRLCSALWIILASGTALLPAGCGSGGGFVPAEQARLVPPGAKLELLWTGGEFTEGPVPDWEGTILFSDIGDRILRFDPRTKQVTVFRAQSGKANGLKIDSEGRLVACEGANGGNRRVSITERNGQVRTLAARWEGKRLNSPNDLAIDGKGNVYFTDPRYAGDEPREIDFEGVFFVAPDGKVTLATKDVEKPNGIVISPKGDKVYIADNNSYPRGNHHLTVFRVQPDGTLADKEILFDFGPDRRGIDGMTMDREGNIYATAGRGELAGIYVFSPKGVQLAFIPTPGDPTNCTFGGTADPGTLYITAQAGAKYGLYRIRLR